MTTIKTNTFILKRYLDSHMLINLTDEDLPYTLKIIKCEEDNENPAEQTLLALESKGLEIAIDGFYELTIGEDTVYFSSFIRYRTGLIELVKKTLCATCGCKPTNCMPKEAIDCLKSQGIFNYMQTYFNLIKPYSLNIRATKNPFLFDFYERAIESNRCFTLEELCKQLLSTCISGTTNNNPVLFNYFISIYYLALYTYDINSIDTTVLTETEVLDEIKHLKKVYKFNEIKNCIRNLGIDLADILEVSDLNTKVYFWQEDSLSSNIGTILPSITVPYLDTKTSLPFSTFLSGYVVPLTVVGRLVFVLKETQMQNVLILDSLGNNITSHFDTDYIVGISATVFVSKEYLNYGTLYFKFKTLT